MAHLEITKVVLVHCNIINNDNDYQQDSRALYNFVWQFIRNFSYKPYILKNIQLLI